MSPIILKMHRKQIKLRPDRDKIWVHFPFSRKIINTLKEDFDKARWHPEKKCWSIADCEHNWFQLRYHAGGDPYRNYDAELLPFETSYPLRTHQFGFASHIVTRRRAIIAGEMGTGKTLAIIAVADSLDLEGEFWWVAPRSALYSVQLEFEKWGAKHIPKFITYASLKNQIGTPQFIVYDESSRVKSPQAQRSQAAMFFARESRELWGNDSWIILATGSPAPKSPLDWYSQCEIACPGFLREGNIHKFKKRLAIVEQRQGEYGVYPELVSWRDSEDKCHECGETKDHINHDPTQLVEDDGHTFKQSKNEVALLHERMRGLVLVQFKKDCLDLPDKQYQEIKCKTPPDVVRAAKLIVGQWSGAKALVLLRELSDGFQYVEAKTDKDIPCELCEGRKTMTDFMWTGDGEPDYDNPEGQWEEVTLPCSRCSATGIQKKIERTIKETACPKDEALANQLDLHEEVGRIVIYAGFTGSVDRCMEIVKRKGWSFIRVDGRGWHSNIGGKAQDLLKVFQEHKTRFPKVAFIAQPGAAGMGLTLTASPTIVYFSNDFNAESRIQSEDRIHRMGMDENRGANIIDLVNLPSDKYVLDNLKKKRSLQNITLGELKRCLMSTT